jgi:predicted dehydrogenase
VTGVVVFGKHVLCEKPFALETDTAREMLAHAEGSGLVHLLGTEFRFDTGQALLARAVHDGLIGDPRLAMFALHVPVLADAESELPAWWTDAHEGGGWMHAHGSQVVDQVRATLGEPDRVFVSLLHITDRGTSADDGFVAHLRLRSGAAVIIQSTPSDRGPMFIETRVVGSRGTAWIDGLGDAVYVAEAGGSRRLAVPDELRTAPAAAPPASTLETTYEQMIGHGLDLGAYTRLAEHFLARITGSEPPPGPLPATFADGVAGTAALEAMRRSAAEHRTVVL